MPPSFNGLRCDGPLVLGLLAEDGRDAVDAHLLQAGGISGLAVCRHGAEGDVLGASFALGRRVDVLDIQAGPRGILAGSGGDPAGALVDQHDGPAEPAVPELEVVVPFQIGLALGIVVDLEFPVLQRAWKKNNKSLDLLWDTAWFYYHKLGFSDESIILRRLFRDDEDREFKIYHDPELEVVVPLQIGLALGVVVHLEFPVLIVAE